MKHDRSNYLKCELGQKSWTSSNSGISIAVRLGSCLKLEESIWVNRPSRSSCFCSLAFSATLRSALGRGSHSYKCMLTSLTHFANCSTAAICCNMSRDRLSTQIWRMPKHRVEKTWAVLCQSWRHVCRRLITCSLQVRGDDLDDLFWQAWQCRRCF